MRGLFVSLLLHSPHYPLVSKTLVLPIAGITTSRYLSHDKPPTLSTY